MARVAAPFCRLRPFYIERKIRRESRLERLLIGENKDAGGPPAFCMETGRFAHFWT